MDLLGQGLKVEAVAARDGEKARAFAQRFGLPKAYAGYQTLLDDPAVDAVYISLPNHVHAEWSMRAARAGKHVLCEKPAALSEAECRAVLEEARRAGVFFMEGFMYRCHPLWEALKSLLAEGRLGEIRMLHSSFCFDMGFNSAGIRQMKATGGGALLDVGCYCLSWSRMITGEEPVAHKAVSRIGDDTGVDEWTSASLGFPSGVSATFQCAIRTPQPQMAVIYGERSRLEIPSPWHLHRERAEMRLVSPRGEEVLTLGDGLPVFAREALRVEEFLDEGQCPDMSWEDSLGQARALEALRRDAGLI